MSCNFFEFVLARSGIPDQLGVCFFVGAILAVIVAAVALSGSRGKHLNDAFARFARQFRGTFRPAQYWGDTPAVSFEHNGSPALLDVVKGVGPRRQTFTQLTFAFRRTVPVEMEIGPEATGPRMGRFAQLLPLTSIVPGGEDGFARRYGVLSSDMRVVAELLSRPLREDLARFADTAGHPLRIYLTRDYMLVRKFGVCRDFGLLSAMAHTAFHLHDRLLLVVNQAGQAEVDIVEADTGGEAVSAGVGPDVKCGVCSEPVTEDRVLCRRCRAPHHRECWDYNRGCAVYACRETAYVRS